MDWLQLGFLHPAGKNLYAEWLICTVLNAATVFAFVSAVLLAVRLVGWST